jgi:hypothetical protein
LKLKTSRIKEFIEGSVSSGLNTAWYIGYSSYITSDGLLAHSNENYATASLGGITPLNIALEEYVQKKGRFGRSARVGILVMDYPEESTGTLIDRIIYTNDMKPTK